MSKRSAMGGVLATLAAAVASFGAVAIAGGGEGREAGPRIVAEPMLATEQGPVTRAGDATITTLYLQNEIVPPEGSGTVVGPTCPRRAGKAIGGGAATDEGIVVSYLSQIRPSNGDIRERTYWVGVDDNAGAVGAGATIEVHCAKGLEVKK